MKQRTPEDLLGRVVWFYCLRRNSHGLRSGKVTRVDAIRSGLRGVTVRTTGRDEKGRKWRGPKMRVPVAELTMPNMARCVGVMWRGRLVPVAEWCGVAS